jgi:hypothetical protein
MSGTCGGGTAPEQVFEWTPAASGLAHVDLCGGSYDTVLYVRTGPLRDGLPGRVQRRCVRFGSALEIYVEAGTTYYLVVDGYSAPGPFVLYVSPPGCAAAPIGGCKMPTASRKGKLQLKDAADDGKDQLSWLWGSGAATSMAEFGSPTSSTGYQMCVYDAGGLVSSAAVTPAGTCNYGKPCWSAKPTSFAYESGRRTASSRCS